MCMDLAVEGLPDNPRLVRISNPDMRSPLPRSVSRVPVSRSALPSILKPPTRKFSEDKEYIRPHIKSIREEGVDDIPASDVVKVRAYKRRGTPIKHDRDSSLVCDKAQARGGDVFVVHSNASASASASVNASVNAKPE